MQADTQPKRHIVGAFDHDDALLISDALAAYRQVLIAVSNRLDSDAVHADADRLDMLSRWFRDANAARDHIEEAGLHRLARAQWSDG